MNKLTIAILVLAACRSKDDRPPVKAAAQHEPADPWAKKSATDIKDPAVDLASDDMKQLKETLQRSQSDEDVGQYIAKVETEIGTSINQAAVAQVTGASSNN